MNPAHLLALARPNALVSSPDPTPSALLGRGSGKMMANSWFNGVIVTREIMCIIIATWLASSPGSAPGDEASYLVFHQALQKTHHYNHARFTVTKQVGRTR